MYIIEIVCTCNERWTNSIVSQCNCKLFEPLLPLLCVLPLPVSLPPHCPSLSLSSHPSPSSPRHLLLHLPPSSTSYLPHVGALPPLLGLQHHCRACGGIFCSSCSDNNMNLSSSSKPVRVCDSCFTLLQQKASLSAGTLFM